MAPTGWRTTPTSPNPLDRSRARHPPNSTRRGPRSALNSGSASCSNQSSVCALKTRPFQPTRKRQPKAPHAGTRAGARGVPATPASRDRGKDRPRDQRSPRTGSCLSPRGLPRRSRTKRGGEPPRDSERSIAAWEAGRENLRAFQAQPRGGRCCGLRRGARQDRRTTRTAPDRELAGRPVAPGREHHEHPRPSPDVYLRTIIRCRPPSVRQTHPARTNANQVKPARVTRPPARRITEPPPTQQQAPTTSPPRPPPPATTRPAPAPARARQRTYTGTPVTQPVATQAPAPAASTESSPPASTGSSPSSSASSTSHSTSQSSTPAKQPAFGSNGTLGPGSSPDS